MIAGLRGWGYRRGMGYAGGRPPSFALEFTSGGGAAADSHAVTLPANAVPALQVVVVRTGGSSVALDMTGDGFAEIATRDGTGRTSVFARKSAANADASVSVACETARAVGWVAFNAYGLNMSLNLTDLVTAAFTGSNSLNPPEVTTAWAHIPLTVATTRRSDNTLTAPENYSLRASGQSSTPGDSTNEARASIGEQTVRTPGLVTDPGTWGSTGTTANPHSATIAVRVP